MPEPVENIIIEAGPKFADILRQLSLVYQQGICCQLFLDFGKKEDDVKLRFTNIDPLELNKLVVKLNEDK